MKISHMMVIGATALLLAAAPATLAQLLPAGEAGTAASAVREIRALFTEGRWGKAVEALRAEAKARPDNEELQFMSAMVAMDSGDYVTALRLYEGLLEKYPDNAGLKNNLAWLHVKATDPSIRNLDLALKEAQEALMAAPQDYNIWNTLGEVYLARGDAMRAMRLAVLARDLATMARERDLRGFQDLVRRCEAAPAGNRP
jgi:tetratricopeptide (TPR) repeat protein